MNDLKSITTLDLDDNEFQNIPLQIGYMEKLNLLYLNGNKIRKLNDDNLQKTLLKLEKMGFLKLAKNGLKDLPENFGNLKVMLEIDLCENNLSEMPFDKLKRIILNLYKLNEDLKIKLDDNGLTPGQLDEIERARIVQAR